MACNDGQLRSGKGITSKKSFSEKIKKSSIMLQEHNVARDYILLYNLF